MFFDNFIFDDRVHVHVVHCTKMTHSIRHIYNIFKIIINTIATTTNHFHFSIDVLDVYIECVVYVSVYCMYVVTMMTKRKK